MSVTCCRSVVFGGYSSFLHQYNWPSLYDWNIIESGFKHHSHNPIYWPLDCVNILLLITFFLLWTIFLVFILHRNSHRTHICTYLETSWIVINKSTHHFTSSIFYSKCRCNFNPEMSIQDIYSHFQLKRIYIYNLVLKRHCILKSSKIVNYTVDECLKHCLLYTGCLWRFGISALCFPFLTFFCIIIIFISELYICSVIAGLSL